MKASDVFKVLGALVALIIIWQVAAHLFGFLILACLVVGFFAIIYFMAKMFMSGKSESTAQNVAPSHRVWESLGNSCLYTKQPTVSELTQDRQSTAIKQLEDQGVVLHIDNDTKVSVLADADKEAVKIKVLEGAYKGKVGWVCRSVLVKNG